MSKKDKQTDVDRHISKIKITVTGPTASGKSRLLADLNKFLESHSLVRRAEITMKGVQE